MNFILPKMSAKITRLSTILLFSIPLLLLIILNAQFWIYDYEIWVKYLLQIAGKEDWESYFKVQILDRQRFLALRYVLLFLTVLFFFLSVFLFKRRLFLFDTIKKDLELISNGIKSSFGVLDKTETAILSLVFLFFVCRALFFIKNTELQYDEAWTFVHFSSKGFLVSALSPNNNHQLYTLFSAFLWKLNLDAKFAVRLPALIFSLFSLFSLFIFVNKIFGKKVSIVCVAVLSVSIPFYFYSVLGRGYAPMLLFTIVSSFSLLKIEKNSLSNIFHFRIFIISTLLGVCSNPAFLFVWILNVLIFIIINNNKKKLIIDFFVANLITSLFMLLLMIPMMVSGAVGILGAAAEKNIETGNFLLYLHRLADWLFLGSKWNVFFVFLGLAFLFLLVNIKLFDFVKHRRIYLLQFFWLFPFLFFISTGIESPYRIWFWMPIFFWLHFVIIIDKIKVSTLLKILIYSTAAVFNFYISHKHYFMNWSLDLDRESKKIAQKILNEKDGTIKCYTFSRYDKPLLDYYFLINNRDYKTFMPFKESRNYLAFENNKFDAVLLDIEDYKASEKELEVLQNEYKVIYQNNRIKLYLNKSQ